jgi:hypothetical protein
LLTSFVLLGSLLVGDWFFLCLIGVFSDSVQLFFILTLSSFSIVFYVNRSVLLLRGVHCLGRRRLLFNQVLLLDGVFLDSLFLDGLFHGGLLFDGSGWSRSGNGDLPNLFDDLLATEKSASGLGLLDGSGLFFGLLGSVEEPALKITTSV